MRQALWIAIAGTLRGEIADGRYRPGTKLPTESELSARFGVNRHTVRHALAALEADGLTHSRRGSGVFVTAKPTDYPIGRRVRFHQNLQAAGREPGRVVRHCETRPANAEEAEFLKLKAGVPVHVVEGTSLADDVPVAIFRSVFPAGRFPDLPDILKSSNSVTAALLAFGVADYTRAWSRITAKVATPTQAVLLQVPGGSPILRTTSLNIDEAGEPVEFGKTWFAGERVSLTVSPD
jgi:GntR family transcriptional regulator, phosphonate transport system regulatory protein